MSKHLTRQAEIIPANVLGEPIFIIGAGAIGSFLTLTLAKMGFTDITVFDFDTIEVENMNSQFYRFCDIGKPKVLALQDLVRDFTGTEIKAIETPYEFGTFRGVIVSAVDSMAVRKLIWENHKRKAFNTLFLDPRMGAETGLLYAMKPVSQRDIDAYEKSLYSDDEAVHERCTAKATMYTATMLSGHVAKTIKDYLVTGNYSRLTQWNILDNAFIAHPAEKKGVAHEKTA